MSGFCVLDVSCVNEKIFKILKNKNKLQICNFQEIVIYVTNLIKELFFITF